VYETYNYIYKDKKKSQRNMKDYDKRKSHINSKIHVSIYLLIMLDTLLLRLSLQI